MITFFQKIKITRTSLSATTPDEIFCGSSIQKLNGGNSKKEKHIASSEKISTNSLHENDTQQSPSYNIITNDDFIHMKAIP